MFDASWLACVSNDRTCHTLNQLQIIDACPGTFALPAVSFFPIRYFADKDCKINEYIYIYIYIYINFYIYKSINYILDYSRQHLFDFVP